MDRKLDELLFALMQNMTIAVSGEKLARDLGVSHSTLVRWIDKLREAGMEIKGELFTGYRLVRLPDVILPQLVRQRLRAREIGRTIYHFYSVDSTNAFASRLLSHGYKVPHGTVIVGETQTAGKGRMGRLWHSERETGLYFSLVIHPRMPATLAPLLTLGTAVAVHDALEKHTRLDIDIKWPNDLLIDGRKISGILAEMVAEVDMVKSMVIGIGINVNQAEFPVSVADRATSLRMMSGHMQSRIDILVEICDEFERLYAEFDKRGPVAIIEPWSRSSSFAEGRYVEINDGVRVIRGATRGLNPLGALKVEADGRCQEVYSGDVVYWE